MWFELKGDERITHRCASDGCGGQVTWKLEADGCGSFYCSGCKARIEANPFGRQPQPVVVQIAGEKEDVDYWFRELKRRAEFKGDSTLTVNHVSGYAGFKIFPRAVND